MLVVVDGRLRGRDAREERDHQQEEPPSHAITGIVA
jgi:hypothetical protein